MLKGYKSISNGSIFFWYLFLARKSKNTDVCVLTHVAPPKSLQHNWSQAQLVAIVGYVMFRLRAYDLRVFILHKGFITFFWCIYPHKKYYFITFWYSSLIETNAFEIPCLLCISFCFVILYVTIWCKDNKLIIYLSIYLPFGIPGDICNHKPKLMD